MTPRLVKDDENTDRFRRRASSRVRLIRSSFALVMFVTIGVLLTPGVWLAARYHAAWKSACGCYFTDRSVDTPWEPWRVRRLCDGWDFETTAGDFASKNEAWAFIWRWNLEACQ